MWEPLFSDSGFFHHKTDRFSIDVAFKFGSFLIFLYFSFFLGTLFHTNLVSCFHDSFCHYRSLIHYFLTKLYIASNLCELWIHQSAGFILVESLPNLCCGICTSLNNHMSTSVNLLNVVSAAFFTDSLVVMSCKALGLEAQSNYF